MCSEGLKSCMNAESCSTVCPQTFVLRLDMCLQFPLERSHKFRKYVVKKGFLPEDAYLCRAQGPMEEEDSLTIHTDTEGLHAQDLRARTL